MDNKPVNDNMRQFLDEVAAKLQEKDLQKMHDKEDEREREAEEGLWTDADRAKPAPKYHRYEPYPPAMEAEIDEVLRSLVRDRDDEKERENSISEDPRW